MLPPPRPLLMKKSIFSFLTFIAQQVEGTAYRGRILVKVESSLDCTIPKMIKQKINASVSDRQELEACGYQKNFKLMAILLSANMVYPNDDLVEFEVSIG